MPAKYQRYPVYIYSEPATYKDFSYGINTNPSNNSLDDKEMRDCLNMHYNSAGLTKRKGAKKLCSIVCNDNLYNIQGIFIFTYKLTYIIVACDGKLYSGYYNKNTEILLTKLPIHISGAKNTVVSDSNNLIDDIPIYYSELLNERHNGFIYRYFINTTNNTPINYNASHILHYNDLAQGYCITRDTIIEDDNEYYISSIDVTISCSTPDAISTSWTQIPSDIIDGNNGININRLTYLVSDGAIIADCFKKKLLYQITLDGTRTYINQHIPTWNIRDIKYTRGDIVRYNGDLYVCTSYEALTSSQHPYLESQRHNYIKLTYVDELYYQNRYPIEAVTLNNVLYIASGTRYLNVQFDGNKLEASVVHPYKPISAAITKIGYNYIAKYYEQCIDNSYNQVANSLRYLSVSKNKGGTYTLTPIFSFDSNTTKESYYYKWEKLIGTEWYTLHSFKDNVMFYEEQKKINDYELIDYIWDKNAEYHEDDMLCIGNNYYKCLIDHTPISVDSGYIGFASVYNEVRYWRQITDTSEIFKRTTCKVKRNANYTTLTVDDADINNYRVTVCKTFDQDVDMYLKYDRWDSSTVYKINDRVLVDTYLFICIKDTTGFETEEFKIDSEDGTLYWELDSKTEESILKYNEETATVAVETDYVPSTTSGDYFGMSTSQLYAEPDTTYFNRIHSCRSITKDGNKLLLYNDSDNSGEFYKTIINNPRYITINDRLQLNFKTTKNEAITKIVPFNGNLIVFTNSDVAGGSIHLVTGGGQDYEGETTEEQQYFSPYKRSIININISTDNPNTVQVAGNYLFFKYFNTIYYIISSDIEKENVNLYSANDKIKYESKYVSIPWDDNSCISEVTPEYYALLWKEKYIIEDDRLILERPALRIKIYYVTYHQIDNKVYFPWLRDESKYFNVDNILYMNGLPVYLYNNILITMNDENTYTDINEEYETKIIFKGYYTQYPNHMKLLSSIIVNYYNTQRNEIDFNVNCINEAGYTLVDSSTKRKSLQDLRVLRTGDKLANSFRLNSSSVISKVINTPYKFPYLYAETTISAITKDNFMLSDITFIYTACEEPEQTPYDSYSNIIRKKEI